ncbi:MAG: glycosyltransferase family 9 protein [Candidatus Omnitrophica bacterium]|nr:glycosyltransferase family 9 protein [Candidatus Omnitrophota bacterium]
MNIEKKEIKRILFISLSNIGDIVLTTPVLKALSDNFSKVRIDMLVGQNGAELFRKHPAVFKVIPYNKHIPIVAKKRLVKKLRRVKYDLIVDLRNSLFPLLVGGRYRTSAIQTPPRSVVHKKQQHLWKLSTLGLTIKDAPFYLHIPKEDEQYTNEFIDNFDKKRPIIAVSPGAKSNIKRWAIWNYRDLINRLVKELNAQVVILGDASDSVLIKEADIRFTTDVVDLSGRTNLCQLASVLRQADLLITNDSAPLHIASAVGTKVLAIFGPTDPKEYGPTGTKDVVIRKELNCSPCRKAECSFHHECMEYIEVDEVFDRAKEMLELVHSQ